MASFFKKLAGKSKDKSSTTGSVTRGNGHILINQIPSLSKSQSIPVLNGDLGGEDSLSLFAHSIHQRNVPDSISLSTKDSASLEDLGSLSAQQILDLTSARPIKSRLSLPIEDLLMDPDASPFFLQFMDSKDLGYLARFCQAAQTFSLQYLPISYDSPLSRSRRSSDSHEDSKYSLHSPLPPSVRLSLSSSSGFSERSSSPVSEEFKLRKSSRAEELTSERHDSAMKIYKTYLEPNSEPNSVPVVTDETLRLRIETKIKSGHWIDPNVFEEAHQMVVKELKKYCEEYQRSVYHYRHQMSVLTSSRVLLADILYCEQTLFHFVEFMEQEGRSNIMEFWLAADNFRLELQAGKVGDQQAQDDAMVLYDKYFSLQASKPLGLDDAVRMEIEENICRIEGPQPDCFERAIRIVCHDLEKNYLPAFLSSHLFFKYLSELIGAIQTSPQNQKMLSGSDSTLNSEAGTGSISSQNTLLAMGSVASNNVRRSRILRNVDDRDLCIDCRDMNDPDALWRRKKYTSISIGKVNALGRFVREIEPEPVKKSESKISKAVRRFVNLEEDKAQEELAWQVAEMIIKDVTAITLGVDPCGTLPPLHSLPPSVSYR